MEMARRPYTMRARAELVEATGDRILDAALELFTSAGFEDVSLDQVANRAGVTRRTVLRRFESKDGLFVAAMARAAETMMRQRDEAAVGDIPGAVANVIDHYERWGDYRLRVIAQEHRIPLIADDARAGRDFHRDWVSRMFAPLIKGLRGDARERRIVSLILLTDVFTWKLLRRDLGLSRAETERLILDLIDTLAGGKS